MIGSSNPFGTTAQSDPFADPFSLPDVPPKPSMPIQNENIPRPTTVAYQAHQQASNINASLISPPSLANGNLIDFGESAPASTAIGSVIGNGSMSQDEILYQFIEYEKNLKLNDLYRDFGQIRQEQDSLRNHPSFSNNVAGSPQHVIRNRYRDILPYDHNRVEISKDEENEDGYMNASKIELPNGRMTFIAAQAPLPSTLDEWWRMIEEQDVRLIIMLCNLNEMGKIKCERYWPERKGEHIVFGDYEVCLEDEEEFKREEFVLRTLKVEKTDGSKPAWIVHQLHYLDWPDHSCPSGERQLLNTIVKMNEIYDTYSQDSPVIVHCSAGVGRTGTIIAVNHLKEQIDKGAVTKVDLHDLVMSLRKQRASMVQTADQYHFVHKCLAYYCKQKLGLIDEDEKEEESLPAVPPRPIPLYDNVPGDDDNASIASSAPSEPPVFPLEPPVQPLGPESLEETMQQSSAAHI
ncbi:hypothetical protein WR25_09852 isoform C [Diploscapter pachys]|nr:hypothetical protein WR25_09852 isoform C [Diploscapter pachys]